MEWLSLVAMLACPASIMFLTAGLARLLTASRDEQRLLDRLWGNTPGTNEAVRRPRVLRLAERFDRSRVAARIRAPLLQANLEIRPVFLACLVVGAGALIYLILWAYLQIYPAVNFVISAVAVFAGLRLYLADRHDHYINEMAGQMPEVAILLSNTLKANLSVRQGIEVVAAKMPPPAGREFSRIAREVALGESVEAGLHRLSERVPIEEVKTIVTTVEVERQAGGNLSRALAIMSNSILDRQRVRAEVRTLTAEARFTGVAMLAMPFVMILVINQVQPGSVRDFLNSPFGWVVVALYAVVQVAAYRAIHHFASIRI